MESQVVHTKKRPNFPTIEDRNLAISEVIQITGRSRSSVLRDIDAGRLPQPFKFPTGRLYWRLSEVKACLDSQVRRNI
jgi:predicted DNA-binding transcriptional regulator AlpA